MYKLSKCRSKGPLTDILRAYMESPAPGPPYSFFHGNTGQFGYKVLSTGRHTDYAHLCDAFMVGPR